MIRRDKIGRYSDRKNLNLKERYEVWYTKLIAKRKIELCKTKQYDEQVLVRVGHLERLCKLAKEYKR